MIKQLINSIKQSVLGLMDDIISFFDEVMLKNIHSCHTITLGDYCKLVCYSKLKLLKKSNIYTPKRVLIQGYSNLLHEYNQLTENTEVKVHDELEKKIERYRKRYLEILSAYIILRHKESIESLLILKHHFVINGLESKKDIFQKCVSTLKGLKVELSAMNFKYEKTKAKKHLTMFDFDKEKAFLKKKGYDVKDSMILSEYIQVQNLLKSEYEEEKKQIDKLKNGRTRNN